MKKSNLEERIVELEQTVAILKNLIEIHQVALQTQANINNELISRYTRTNSSWLSSLGGFKEKKVSKNPGDREH